MCTQVVVPKHVELLKEWLLFCVEKAVSFRLSSSNSMWKNASRRSRVVNRRAPFRVSMISSNFKQGNTSLIVMLLSFLKSRHTLIPPDFFLTTTRGNDHCDVDYSMIPSLSCSSVPPPIAVLLPDCICTDCRQLASAAGYEL